MARQPIARLIKITKTYGDTVALDSASVDIFPSEVMGLVGANGSGKTTLMSILCGNILPDTGEIWIEGSQVRFQSTADAIARGVRMLSQHLELYPSLSILENIFIGQEITRRLRFPRIMAWARMEDAAKVLLNRVDANSIDPRCLAGNLSGGQQKAIALARLLAGNAKILAFDEPCAALGVRQKIRLLEILKSEAASDRSVIFSSHDIEDILSVCDRVVVLRKGRIISDINREDIDEQLLSSQMTMA